MTSAQQPDHMSSLDPPRTSDSGLLLNDLQTPSEHASNWEIHLELCVSRGIESIHWGEIKLGSTDHLSVDSDASLFGT
jgi:hypothetical protein